MILTGKTEVLGEKPVPMPLCTSTPQISNGIEVVSLRWKASY